MFFIVKVVVECPNHPDVRHEEWIINNGIFADFKGEKSFIEKTTEKIQTIQKESTNTADELLKWAELKEKGLINHYKILPDLDWFEKAVEDFSNGDLKPNKEKAYLELCNSL